MFLKNLITYGFESGVFLSSFLATRFTEKKAVFIPTPGQFEQLYLSEKLSQEKIVLSIKQEAFSYSDLKWNKKYSGFSKMDSEIDYKKLFSLF